ncbi:conserved Plasmodium protein, unknown function [Plasmodium gaboni]|uniref:Uncharacterized protein n=1 Tax=Plasmodium gaboni TaxID=647221 RepID=A0ABY1UM61_9APIC|nr:conserved Plasmodium protein, unknown function [Plasmodium gaboni]
MGCRQSKANDPKEQKYTEDEQNVQNVQNAQNVQNEKNEETEVVQINEKKSERPIAKKKQLDVKPPPVKAIPKIAPKNIQRRDN